MCHLGSTAFSITVQEKAKCFRMQRSRNAKFAPTPRSGKSERPNGVQLQAPGNGHASRNTCSQTDRAIRPSLRASD